MGISITIHDQNTQGWVYNHTSVWFDNTRVSLRDLIAHRVRQEVELINSRKVNSEFHSLVQPIDTEKGQNGYTFTRKKQIDAEQQVTLALNAFESNGFFVLVDDLQLESLDDELDINDDTNVSFLKLVPLVGG